MKRILYLFAAVAMMVACSEKKAGYTITGSVTMDGSADGDTVFLVEWKDGREINRVDTALLANGTFAFEGVQDSVKEYFISVFSNEQQKYISHSFFLENGDICVEFGDKACRVTGSPCNDAYTAYCDGQEAYDQQFRECHASKRDSSLTEEQHKAKETEIDELNKEFEQFVFDQLGRNITTPVGVRIFRDKQIEVLLFDAVTVDSLLRLVPDQYATPVIHVLRSRVAMCVKTAVGRKFTDFEMETPEGKAVKLSDFVGKHKVVFVDFWASWCGPCRASLPGLKQIYAEYKDKGLEIVGVSLDGSADNWKDAIKSEGLTWPQMSDLKGWGCEGASLYGVASIPSTVLLNSEGIIVARDLSEKQLKAKLEELL